MNIHVSVWRACGVVHFFRIGDEVWVDTSAGICRDGWESKLEEIEKQ